MARRVDYDAHDRRIGDSTSDGRFIAVMEWGAFDQYLRLRPTEPPDDRIAIVGINEADLQEIGQPIIPDAIYARLLEKLKARQPESDWS
jgi:adenylate cyclase